MIKHIVWWTLKPEAEGRGATENAKRIKEMGEALNGKIPGLLSLEISSAIMPSSSVEAGLALCTVHNTMEDLALYAEHPLHQELLHLIRACTSTRQCLDFEL